MINQSAEVVNESDLSSQLLRNTFVPGAKTAIRNLAVFSRKGTETQEVATAPLLTEVEAALAAVVSAGALRDVQLRPGSSWLPRLVDPNPDEAQPALSELISTTESLVRRRDEILEHLRGLPDVEFDALLRDAGRAGILDATDNSTATAKSPVIGGGPKPQGTNLAVQARLLSQALNKIASLCHGLARHYCLRGQNSAGLACTLEAIMVGGPSPSWRPAVKPLLTVPLAEPPQDTRNELPDSATRFGWIGAGDGPWNPNVAVSIEGQAPERRAELWYKLGERWRLLGSVTNDDLVQSRFIDRPPKYAQLIWSGEDGWTVLHFCVDHPETDPGIYWRRGAAESLIEVKGEFNGAP